MIDRGAELGWISQYPHEAECLFAPLTGLEVQGVTVEGTVLVVEARLSVNLNALTIEQVVGARKKMLEDMVPGLEGEVRQALDVEGIANAEGSRWVAGLLRPALEAEGGALSHPTDWYNDDERLAAAMQQMLDAKRHVGPGGLKRAEAL